MIDLVAPSATTYQATGIRASSGQPLGNFRWLVWAVFPGDSDSVQDNTAVQELQVIPAAASRK